MTNKATTGVGAPFAKLLEYEKRAESFSPEHGFGRGADGTWSGVIFKLGGAQLACNVDLIHEILPYPQATPVPGAKPWILGLANVRGSLLTVIDLAWYLTGERSPVTAETRLLTAMMGKAPIGLMIDEVFGQRHFNTEESRQPELPDQSPLTGIVSREHIAGTESWHELDLGRLFNGGDFQNGAAD